MIVRPVLKMELNVCLARVMTEKLTKTTRAASVKILHTKIKINYVNFVIPIKTVSNASIHRSAINVTPIRTGMKLRRMVNAHANQGTLKTATVVHFVHQRDAWNAKV